MRHSKRILRMSEMPEEEMDAVLARVKAVEDKKRAKNKNGHKTSRL